MVHREEHAAKHIKVPDVKPIHTVAKSAVDKGINSGQANTYCLVTTRSTRTSRTAEPKHSAIQSAMKDGKLKPKDPDPVHTPIQSNLKDKGEPVHGAVQSAIKDGKLKPKDPEPVHTPIQSTSRQTDPVHGAVQSAIKDGKLKPKDPDPVHSRIQSNLKGKTDPVHSPVQSAVKDGKLKPVEPVHALRNRPPNSSQGSNTIAARHSNAAKSGVIKPIEPVTARSSRPPNSNQKMCRSQPRGVQRGEDDSGYAEVHTAAEGSEAARASQGDARTHAAGVPQSAGFCGCGEEGPNQEGRQGQLSRGAAGRTRRTSFLA